MSTLNKTSGYINILMFVCEASYIIVSLVRKVRHTRMLWSFISTMTLLSLVIGSAQIVYNDILDGLCNFYLKVLYGIEVITLFSITAIIAYYMRNLIYDIYEFAIHQTLLSEAVKKKRN